MKTLLVLYKNTSKTWMTTALFTELYDEIFIPGVTKHKQYVEEEVEVLIDQNAATHLTEELLERENDQFTTIFFPRSFRHRLIVTKGPVC